MKLGPSFPPPSEASGKGGGGRKRPPDQKMLEKLAEAVELLQRIAYLKAQPGSGKQSIFRVLRVELHFGETPFISIYHAHNHFIHNPSIIFPGQEGGIEAVQEYLKSTGSNAQVCLCDTRKNL